MPDYPVDAEGHTAHVDANEIVDYINSGSEGAYVVGIDWGKGSDVTVYRCNCGFTTEKLEELAGHAIDTHRLFCG